MYIDSEREHTFRYGYNSKIIRKEAQDSSDCIRLVLRQKINGNVETNQKPEIIPSIIRFDFFPAFLQSLWRDQFVCHFPFRLDYRHRHFGFGFVLFKSLKDKQTGLEFILVRPIQHSDHVWTTRCKIKFMPCTLRYYIVCCTRI